MPLGGAVIFLEGCHHNGVLIDSSANTPCLTPEALNPDCATQVTNKGPEANNSCIFIPNVDLTTAAFLAALFPQACFNTELRLMALVSHQLTLLRKHYVLRQQLPQFTSDKQDVYMP